jgi:hypothetical protein
MELEVRHLLLCDDVQTDPNNYQRINVIGLLSSIQSPGHSPLPVVRPLLCALVMLTGGPDSGQLILRIFHARTGRFIFRSSSRQVRFVGDPGAVSGIVFRIRNCSFPLAGLYWVEVVFKDAVLARQRLWLKT